MSNEEYLRLRGWTFKDGEWFDKQGNPWGGTIENALLIEQEEERFRLFGNE